MAPKLEMLRPGRKLVTSECVGPSECVRALGGVSVLVQVRDLVLDSIGLVIDADFHVPVCQCWTGREEAVLEDLVEVRCGEDFGPVVVEAEEVLEDAAG